jgi:hypothetical protein
MRIGGGVVLVHQHHKEPSGAHHFGQQCPQPVIFLPEAATGLRKLPEISCPPCGLFVENSKRDQNGKNFQPK